MESLNDLIWNAEDGVQTLSLIDDKPMINTCMAALSCALVMDGHCSYDPPTFAFSGHDC